MLSDKAKKKIPLVLLLAVVLALVIDFFVWWRSLYYALYAVVCDPTSGNYDCPGYNPLAAFAVDWAYTLNCWGILVTAISTFAIAWFTLSLRDATRMQGRTAERAGEHFQATERAYVKMSHVPPGAQFANDLGQQVVIVSIRVENFGHTPAYVTDIYLDVRVLEENEPLPVEPEYPPIDGHEPVEGFLVAGDKFDHMVPMNITGDQVETMNRRSGRLIVLGYVDYRDKFGISHRGAYAREYDDDMDDRKFYRTEEDWEKRNNLPMVTQARYNDDYPVTPA